MAAGQHTHTSKINDRWLFYVVYPLLALALVHTGNENSLRQLLQIPSYYSDLLLAFTCVYTAGFYLRHMQRRAAERFGWDSTSGRRAAWTFLFCFLLPLCTGIGIEILYVVFLLNIPLSESPVFVLELPLAALVLAILNLLYFFLYYRAYTRQVLLQKEDASTPGNVYPPHFLVYAGSQALQIPAEDVAYFMIREKNLFLVRFSGENFLMESSLEDLAKKADPAGFFQLNRQVIASRRSIQSWSPTDTRKLLVQLFPEPGTEVYVSKARAAVFSRWLKSN